MKKKSLSAKKKIHNSILRHLNNQKILKIFKEFNSSLKINEKFAVAVSGGSDSLSLAFFAKCFSLINELDVKFYIINHNLRKDSMSEAKLVASRLKKFDINCKILNWRGKKPSKNIQAIARDARYYLLINECKKNKINYILIGHHIDDLYENFLLRLLRGSGLKGLTSFGKTAECKKNSINIFRPLINVEKKDLIYLSRKVFNFFIEDPSNLNENFKRIRIRNLLKNLEKEGLDKKKLKLTINNLKDTNEAINFYVNKNILQNAKFFKKRNIFMLSKVFFEQPHEIVFRSLSSLLNIISGKYYPPRGKSIDELINKIKSNQINIKTTLGGCFIEKVNETVLILRENSLKG
jgi:tRNA(Ile)-lysidine synthase|tara:strand:- start:911 stop:1960 length:1050 start_codon:yes stop_codon:yes gene_type:complete